METLAPGLNLMTLLRADIEEGIAAAAEAGFEFVELWTDSLEKYLRDHDIRDLRHLLSKHRLKVVSIGDIESVTFRTPEEFAELRDHCSRLAAVAREIGCPSLVVSGSVRPRRADAAMVMAEIVSALGKLLDSVEPQGIGLALTFKGFPWCSVNSLAQVTEAVAYYHDRQLGFALDTFDLHAAHVSPQALRSISPEKIFVLRMSDCGDIPAPLLTDTGRVLPGEGKADLRTMLDSIVDAGFAGPVSLKALSPRLLDISAKEIAAAAMAAIERCLNVDRLKTGV